MAFRFDPPYGKPWLLYGLLGCSLLLNVVMVLDEGPAAGPASASAEADVAPSLETASPSPAEGAVPPPALPSAPAVAPMPGDWTVTSGEVSGTLAATFRGAVGEDGDALSAVFSRLFVWDMELRRDVMKGDHMEVAWHKNADGIYEIAAARLHSSKLGRTLTAYRWQAPGDAYPSYWQEDGTEVPYRLQSSPLIDYEQITSLLRDRPTHKGMDFKTPVGTEVVSPKAGVVTRVNWNWASNGNCVEVQFDDGAVAKFLHLSENKVDVGTRVAPNQVLALSGNTGHSMGPHLHYQVEVGGKVVDPIDYHGAVRRNFEASQSPAFQADRARLDALLGQSLAAR